MLLNADGGADRVHRPETIRLKYRFATQEEGRQLKLANTGYLEALTQNDIDWKLQTSGQSLEEFKAVAVFSITPLLYELLRRIPFIRWAVLGEKK